MYLGVSAVNNAIIAVSVAVTNRTMPRKPRFYLPNVPIHIVQRGNNQEAIFFEDSDYQAYLDWLQQATTRYGCSLHAYVLMTNHVHLLATPADKDSVSRMIQFVGRQYVPYINRKYNRTGTLWEGRYKGNLVQSEPYLLECMRYIELNPVRANRVASVTKYPWSSYQANGRGYRDELITPHSVYLGLGVDEKSRRQAYRNLIRRRIDEVRDAEIHAAWQSGTPLATEAFKEKIEKKLKMKVGYARRGRPRLEID